MHLSLFGARAGIAATNADVLEYLLTPFEAEEQHFRMLWNGCVRDENKAILRVIDTQPTVLVTGTGLHSTYGLRFLCNEDTLTEAIHEIKVSYWNFSPTRANIGGPSSPEIHQPRSK